MIIAVNDDFLINSLQCQLENDFSATAENKICLWFKYNSVLSNIHVFPDIRKNHWITIPDNFTKIITVGDIGVDIKGDNVITILVDIRLESPIDNILDTSGLYYKTELF
eukprot:187090_1